MTMQWRCVFFLLLCMTTGAFSLSQHDPFSSDVAHDAKATWAPTGRTVAGGNGAGGTLKQLNNSYGVFVHANEDLFVSDYFNNRVVKWAKDASTGVLYAGGRCGADPQDHLCSPTALTFDNEGTMYVTVENNTNGAVLRMKNGATAPELFISTDTSLYGIVWDAKEEFLYLGHHREHRVVKYTKDGQVVGVVAGGNGRGSALNQLDYPRGVAVDEDGSVYVADSNNQRLIKWAKGAVDGVVVFGGHGAGNRTDQLNTPAALVRDADGTIYVVDERNDRIVAVNRGAQDGIVIAGDSAQLNSPIYLAFNGRGDLYVSDLNNFRVQMFEKRSGPSSDGLHVFRRGWLVLFCFASLVITTARRVILA